LNTELHIVNINLNKMTALLKEQSLISLPNAKKIRMKTLSIPNFLITGIMYPGFMTTVDL